MFTHTKRLVSITLDVECYDDLDLEELDWNEFLGLEGDENVHVTIKELAEIFWVDSSQSVPLCHKKKCPRVDTLRTVFLFYGRFGDDAITSSVVPPTSSDFL